MTLLDRLRKAVAPRYTVDREIARGGMGTIFAGQDTRLDRPVAFKVLMPELASEEFSRRFLHEAQMMAKVRHPNVVVVHDSGEREGLSFFVMDYIEGETLAQRLERGPLDADAAGGLARDILGPLAAVHRHGIVHRDVKPGNDWDETPTNPGRQVGTPRYWAPEQSDGLEVTRAADIYSAGVVLYQAWTGRDWPLRREPSTGDWRLVPPSARPALAKALAPRPEDRWQAAGDFAAALKERSTGVRLGHVIVGAVAALIAVALIAVLWTVRGPGPDALPELYRELTSAQLEPDLRLRFQRFDSIVRVFPRRWIATFIYADELFHRGPLIGIPLDSALRHVGGSWGVRDPLPCSDSRLDRCLTRGL